MGWVDHHQWPGVQMGEYEHIADPGKEQRPPRASGSDARAPFRPPQLVSRTCFTEYEVWRRREGLSA